MSILKWIIRIIVEVIFLFTLFTFLLSAYEKENEKNSTSVSLLQWLLAFLYEFFLSIFNLIIYPLGVIDFSAIKTGKEDKDIPVVLVHPYMMNRICMFYIFLRLKLKGYKNVFVLNLRPKTAPIEKQAEILKKEVDEILEITGKNELIGIGHSQGGIILRYYSNYLDSENKLKKIICIGSPHKGTKIAVFSTTPNGREMRYRCNFINELNRKKKTNVQILSIYSPIDNLVLPSHSAILEGAINVETPPIGHISLLFSPYVFHRVLEFIEDSGQTSPQ